MGKKVEWNQGGGDEPALRWLTAALGGQRPFPWQETLLARLRTGACPRAIDLPTGLGKTAVMAIWLIARASGAALPRRLVYVVDRRAVVDQATEVAVRLRALVDEHAALRAALGIAPHGHLAISTLRGQLADNREWLADPAAPAIILGTVDMVGSRLLFEGYGTTRKMRPYHAGLLGADTLIALDEAHLVPPFQRLVEALVDGDAVFGPRDPALRPLVPRLRLMALSATGATTGDVFALTPADRADATVRRRLGARKRLQVRAPIDGGGTGLADALVAEAWSLSDEGRRAARYLVYCNSRDVAQKVHDVLAARKGVIVELFVGGRRAYERQAAAERLRELGYLAGHPTAPPVATFLVATSAGEVGVDLDADQMVSDLVAWERMVQRLGRVNRRGEGDATVVVVPVLPDAKTRDALGKVEAYEAAKTAAGEDDVEGEESEAGETDKPKKKPKKEEWLRAWDARLVKAAGKALAELPRVDGAHDASPGAVSALRADPRHAALLANASTPAPLHPELTRAVVEAWSMTSLDEHPGRPEVQPWVRGWIDEDPQTVLVWREHLPLREGKLLPAGELEGALEAAPPHALERLETESWRALDWLLVRAVAVAEQGQVPRDGLVVLVLPAAGKPAAWTSDELDRAKGDKWMRERLERQLPGATLLLDVRLGGLSPTGLLDRTAAQASDVGALDALPFRVRRTDSDAPPEDAAAWRPELRLVAEVDGNGEAERWLVFESRVAEQPESEEGRSTATRAQLLDEHQTWAERRARSIAERLGLPQPWANLLALAARLHDEGKRSSRWQRAFRAGPGGPWGKTRSRPSIALLDGYRHEFGSLPLAERDPRVQDLEPERRDLLLHLIAAHHGKARPVISTRGCDDAPPSALVARARDVALRFSRLEARWGPWGLAWWESLLRAADVQASRENDEGREVDHG